MNLEIPNILQKRPSASAVIKGDDSHHSIHGCVRFYHTDIGVAVYADVNGLPSDRSQVFGFHIHSGNSCTGDMSDHFANVHGHYNPSDTSHPFHAGDLPPLFGNRGRAITVFLTDRFNIKEIIGRTIIIHQNPDDFTTQPSGNSGNKIACGEIRPYNKLSCK